MTDIGGRYAMIHINNQFGFDYISYLTVGDKTVFCIEPMQLFTEGLDYHEDTAKWDELSEQTRQVIWEISYYGYSYPGHQTEKILYSYTMYDLASCYRDMVSAL